MSKKTEVAKTVEELNETFKIDAEKSVMQMFPERILNLNKLLAQPKFSCSREVSTLLNTEDCVDECNAKSTTSTGSYSTVDKKISEKSEIPSVKDLFDISDSFSRQLIPYIADLYTLRTWMKLLIPKIETGNELRSRVIKKIRSHISVLIIESKVSMQSMLDYYQERAYIQSKITKYPLIEDYQKAVIELDEYQLVKMVLYIYEIRDGYLKLYDVIKKNLDIIKPPVESNIEFLY